MKLKNIRSVSLILVISIIILFIIRSVFLAFYSPDSRISAIIANLVYSFKDELGNITFYFLMLLIVFIIVFFIITIYKKVRKLTNEDKYVIKFLFNSILYFASSIIVVKVFSFAIEIIFSSFQNSSSILIYEIYRLYNVIYYNYLNPFIWYIVIVLFYVRISKNRIRRFKNLLVISSNTSNNDINDLIDNKNNDEITYIAKNINSIITKLNDAAEEERNAQKTKSDLITNISHDLRTPLTSIIGYLSLIDKDEYKDEVELRYYISIAYEKSKKLNVLINDLFELTKMQNYQVKMKFSKINLVELLGQITAEFDAIMKSNNMELRVDFCNEKLMINADADKLVRVFENLISNSIKYAKEGYYIDVVTKRDNDEAVIMVINYGEEISSVELPYIFDRFYRIDKSRNSDNGGSGLGLSIAKNIVELHNGSICAYSSMEKTIFEVKLPLCK